MDDKRIAEIKERLELAPSYCKENVTTGPVEHAVGLFSQDLDLGEFALVFGPHSQADDESLARLFQHAPADILDLLADNEALRDLATRQHAMLERDETKGCCTCPGPCQRDALLDEGRKLLEVE